MARMTKGEEERLRERERREREKRENGEMERMTDGEE